jgi:hypothetical protein
MVSLLLWKKLRKDEEKMSEKQSWITITKMELDDVVMEPGYRLNGFEKYAPWIAEQIENKTNCEKRKEI